MNYFKKILFFLFSFFLLLNSSIAQTDLKPDFRKHTFFFSGGMIKEKDEEGLYGGIITMELNYEKYFGHIKKLHFSGRAGLGGGLGFGGGMSVGLPVISLSFNSFYGNKAHHPEVDLGVLYVIPYAGIGYRYQKPGSGFLFKLMLNGVAVSLINEENVNRPFLDAYPQICIGYGF